MDQIQIIFPNRMGREQGKGERFYPPNRFENREAMTGKVARQALFPGFGEEMNLVAGLKQAANKLRGAPLGPALGI
jgi:hypothetical protein